MKIHQIVFFFPLIAPVASAPVPEEGKRSSILNGYGSAGDMDFPGGPKIEPTKEQDRTVSGIWIPHTIDWKFPSHVSSQSEAGTDVVSSGAQEMGDDTENP
ncbi:hypothetical protein BDV26DRAFT_292938 [Aspergillus bertholletiae]|uniref:Uncharacterized protein n=1 Tax=Aspergillus bertholletiae TaxID=1226010 RepID=A0A5N7B7I6_9EURO|nr:hypothetical protein BDV26DRAFT_292938 [Aspergillus bertholletiae]